MKKISSFCVGLKDQMVYMVLMVPAPDLKVPKYSFHLKPHGSEILKHLLLVEKLKITFSANLIKSPKTKRFVFGSKFEAGNADRTFI